MYCLSLCIFISLYKSFMLFFLLTTDDTESTNVFPCTSRRSVFVNFVKFVVSYLYSSLMPKGVPSANVKPSKASLKSYCGLSLISTVVLYTALIQALNRRFLILPKNPSEQLMIEHLLPALFCVLKRAVPGFGLDTVVVI